MTKERKATDTAVMIVSMHGEPDYAGKVGRILYTDDAGHIHGTWGGCALIPGEDVYVEKNLLKELRSAVGEIRTRAEIWSADMVEDFSRAEEDEDLLISWAEEMESASAFLREMLDIQRRIEEGTSFDEVVEGLETPLLQTLNDEFDSLRSHGEWIHGLILSEIGRIARKRH